VGNPTAVLRINNANSSLTIDVKNEIMNKRIGSTQTGKFSASISRTALSSTVTGKVTESISNKIKHKKTTLKLNEYGRKT